jgi:phage terminase Nu1 subunit (DNA packaging protein)
MSRPSKSNAPTAPLRWSIERAGIEFGLTSNTLRKSLGRNSAEPDSDGLYTTAQVTAAIYGALHQEKLRTQREIADRYMLENQITRGEMLNRASLSKALAAIADAMVSRIMASGVPRSVKEDLLKELASIPLIRKEVAHAQTRLPRGNGKRPDEDGSES